MSNTGLQNVASWLKTVLFSDASRPLKGLQEGTAGDKCTIELISEISHSLQYFPLVVFQAM